MNAPTTALSNAPPAVRRKRRWRWPLVLLVLAIAGGAGVTLAKRRAAEPVDPSLVVVATRGPLAVDVLDVGRIEALHQVEVESKVPGRVSRVMVDEGDRVEAGDELLLLDKRDFSRAVAREQAELRHARARLSFLTLERERKERGNRDGVVSGVESARGKHDAELAAIEVDRARVALAVARDRLRDSRIAAPIAGTVIRRAIEPGEMVVPGVESRFEKRSLLTIADLSKLVVRIELNQIDVAQVKIGQRVTLSLDALPGVECSAKVSKIAPASVALPGKELEVFPVEAVLDRADPRIKPGMTADVRIHVLSRPSVLSLPLEAVRRQGDRAHVTRVLEDEAGSRTEQIEVVLGARSDRSVEISSGLAEGDRVLIDPPSAAANEAKL